MSRGPGWPKGWWFPVAKVAAGTHQDRTLRRALYTAGALVFALGFWGWRIYQPDLPVLTCAYRTLLLFFVDDSSAAAPVWQLNLARFLAPIVTAAATIALFLTATRRRLQSGTASRAKGHVVLVGPEERTSPYAADRPDAMRVHVGPEPDAPGPGLIHVQGAFDRPDGVAAAAVADADLVVLAAGDDSTNLAAFDAVMAAWPEGGPVSVHLELGDRSTATWLSLSLARSHPDRDVEVCCYEEGLARQAVQEVIAGIAARDLLGDGPTPRFAVFGDGREVPLLVHQLALALSLDHHQRGGAAVPELMVVDCPRAAEVVTRLQALAGQVQCRIEARLADVVRDTDRPLVAVVAHADPDRRLQVAAELAARRLDAEVYVTDRRRFEALRIRTLDPDAAHTTGALDGAFVRAAKDMVDDLRRNLPELWPAWPELSVAQRAAAAGWLRLAVATLLANDGPVGGVTWTVDLPPSSLPPDPLPLAAARDLVARIGEPRPDGPTAPIDDPTAVDAAVARAYGQLPVWVFHASDLYLAAQE
ncbi:MAG: hypothetical protein U0P45_14030 [Acidimicrobiales bacterium]